MNYTKKIYGAITGAAVGEALGAGTAFWTTDIITEKYNGYLTDLVDSPASGKCKGKLKAGQVTDGFYFVSKMVERFIKDKGIVVQEAAQEVNIDCYNDETFKYLAKINSETAYNQFAADGEYRYPYLTFDHHRATYEAASRAVAIAAFLPGNADMAVEQMVHAYRKVFNNIYCLSGAGAVAAAIVTAMQDGVSYLDILKAGVFGADRAEKCADSFRCQPCALSKPLRRIQMAIDIGMENQDDFAVAMKELEERIGTSEVVSESVATAFGIIAATKGNYDDALKMAVNIGGETDGIAAIVGAILGAFTPEKVNKDQIKLVEEVNGFDFDKMSNDISAVAEEIKDAYI